jgi:hypothetical protein
MVGLGPHLATERARLEPPHLPVRAPGIYPDSPTSGSADGVTGNRHLYSDFSILSPSGERRQRTLYYEANPMTSRETRDQRGARGELPAHGGQGDCIMWVVLGDSATYRSAS